MMLPFVGRDTLWRSGLAGAIPSGFCFVVAGAFLFAAVRRVFASTPAALTAVALFALNPNMLYLQSIPMTEPGAYACLMALLYFTVRFRETQGWGALTGAAIAVSCWHYGALRRLVPNRLYRCLFLLHRQTAPLPCHHPLLPRRRLRARLLAAFHTGGPWATRSISTAAPTPPSPFRATNPTPAMATGPLPCSTCAPPSSFVPDPASASSPSPAPSPLPSSGRTGPSRSWPFPPSFTSGACTPPAILFSCQACPTPTLSTTPAMV